MIQEPPTFHESKLFVEIEFGKDIECSMCHEVQNDCVICKEGHEFCKSCISESSTCPTCKEVLLDISVPNRDAGRCISEEFVYCYTRLPQLLTQGTAGGGDKDTATETADPTISERDSQLEGSKDNTQVAVVDHCTWTGQLKDAIDHFCVCGYAGMLCSLEGCGVVVARKDKTQHEATCDPIKCKWEGCDVKMRSAALALHELDCQHRVVTCPNAGCGSKGTFANLPTHRGGECRYEEVACVFATHGCTARMLRKDVDSHDDATMKEHLRLMAQTSSERQLRIKKHQEVTKVLLQAHESLKHHAMPVDELIVLQVKYDELTGKVPFEPRFLDNPTRLYSEDRVVRGYRVSLLVETNDYRPEYQDHYGMYLKVEGGPFPCKVQYTSELVHHDKIPASTVKHTITSTYANATGWGNPTFVPKTCLASADNNPYVKDSYVTFTCSFIFMHVPDV